MRYFYLFLLIILFSCGPEKVIELPEIKQASIIEVHDVSPAYLFFNENQPDSVELNRKNLISTTNWLVNIDKRLTLGQVIPKIIFIQNKKRNAEMHKNEDAKNYFTCHDLSKNNLGFIEFTNVYYNINSPKKNNTEFDVFVESLDKITIRKTSNVIISIESNLKNLVADLSTTIDKEHKEITCHFKNTLTFQDYISLKSRLITFDEDQISINSDEFIY